MPSTPAAKAPAGRRGRPPGPARQAVLRRDGRRGLPGRQDPATASVEVLKEVALDLFARRGLHGVTIKDIAAETGLNTSLIYYYFGSKEDLFLQTVQLAVDRAFAQFAALAAGHTDPRQIIHDWIETHIAQRALIGKLVQISLDYARSAKREARIDAAVAQFYQRERAVLSAAIDDGVSRALFRPADAAQMSGFISTFLDGAMVRATLFADFDQAGAIRDLQRFVLTLLGASRTETGAVKGAPRKTGGRGKAQPA